MKTVLVEHLGFVLFQLHLDRVNVKPSVLNSRKQNVSLRVFFLSNFCHPHKSVEPLKPLQTMYTSKQK